MIGMARMFETSLPPRTLLSAMQGMRHGLGGALKRLPLFLPHSYLFRPLFHPVRRYHLDRSAR